MTVGEILTEEFLKPRNMSHEELAEATGVSPQDVGDIICGQRCLNVNEERLLAQMFGIDEDFWSNLQELQDRKEK